MLELYKEEVKELTDLLRNEWPDIQKIATDNGLDISNTYLFSFIESEDDDELCLFYEEGKGFFLYEKKDNEITFQSKDKDSLEKEFPQVQTLDDLNNFENW